MVKELRTFVIVNPDGTEQGGYKGRQPRQAAIKAAREMGGTKDKPVEFKLRQRGTKKIHIFSGYTEVVDAPKNRPAWMKEKFTVARVSKKGTEKIEKKKAEPEE